MQNKDKGDEIEDSPLDMLLVIFLEGASMEVSWLVTPSSSCVPWSSLVNFFVRIGLVGRVSSFELGEGEHFNVCKGELIGIKGK